MRKIFLISLFLKLSTSRVILGIWPLSIGLTVNSLTIFVICEYPEITQPFVYNTIKGGISGANFVKIFWREVNLEPIFPNQVKMIVKTEKWVVYYHKGKGIVKKTDLFLLILELCRALWTLTFFFVKTKFQLGAAKLESGGGSCPPPHCKLCPWEGSAYPCLYVGLSRACHCCLDSLKLFKFNYILLPSQTFLWRLKRLWTIINW